MRNRLLDITVVFGLFISWHAAARACNPGPEVVIGSSNPTWVHVGRSVPFTGHDSTWPLIEWTWDPKDGSEPYHEEHYNCGAIPPPDSGHVYSSVGRYYPDLTIVDCEDPPGDAWGYFTVIVVRVWLTTDGPAYMAVNDDDDNENSIFDNYYYDDDEHNEDLQVPGENDLFPVHLHVDTPSSYGYVRLSVVHGGIRVWSDPDRQNCLIDPGSGCDYTEWIVSRGWPDTVWVEGIVHSPELNSHPRKPYVEIGYVAPYGGWPPYYPLTPEPPDESNMVRLTVVQVDMDMDGVADDRHTGSQQWRTEEMMPGGFIPLGEVRKLTAKKVQPGDLTGNVTLRVETNGDGNVRIWNNEQMAGDPLALPATLPMPTEATDLWVEGYELSSAVRDITLVYEYTVAGKTFDDRINLTVVQLDFVRLWDAHKVANRTTRAIDEELRDAMAFEDNPRSDSELLDNYPMLVLGGWCSEMSGADIKLECGFSPSGAGECVLWSITGPYSYWVAGPTTGSFAASEIVDIHLDLPSTGSWAAHEGKDIAIAVGLDRNGDGVLEEPEAVPDIEWGTRVINKSEYDYCRGKREYILLNLLWIVWPDACEFMDIFLDENTFADYSASCPSTIDFGDGRYSQKNGLGCDATSLTEGSLTRYDWYPATGLWERIWEDAEFWEEVIVQCLIEMDILGWYNSHPGQDSHTFETSRSCGIAFTQDGNLHYAFHAANVSISCQAHTVRGSALPEVIGLSIEGNVTDLYDWPTTGEDDWPGWLARIQTCYAPSCNRTAGNIFKVDVQVDASASFLLPRQYDNYWGIHYEWLQALLIF